MIIDYFLRLARRPSVEWGGEREIWIMNKKAQNNSVFARIWRSKYQTLYGTACFLLMYLLLLYFGSRIVLVVGLCERGKRLLSFLIVGLIILASSLLSKMFQDWFREIKNREKGNNGGVRKEGL